MRKPRILIANRGEIAVRVIRTCRELGIPSVAVYSDADRDALHVEMADSSYRIGPPTASESYLSIGAILDAARKSKATMVHPGYGFLAERSHFAQAVAEAGLTFIGPSPEAIETMGDKMAARRVAEEAGVPIVPGTTYAVGVERAVKEAERIGFPVAVKAAFGGGGRGMRVVRKPEDLDEALAGAAREAQAYFGRPEVYLERYLDRAHHVEAQVMADAHGNVSFLGERDCSLQRRHQKLVEETPSPIVDEGLRERIGEAAVALAKKANYTNAGTVECIADEEGGFYFLEMNTRLQVEHTVTEMVTGLDIVALQIQAALGERLQLSPEPRGHSIECRINAEDPSRDFQPGPGLVTRFDPPLGPFVRLDAGVTAGRGISPEYDSMIAKLIVWGADREEARHRMLRALSEFHVEGVPTTIPFHRWVLKTPEFGRGEHTTTWVERALADGPLASDEHPPAVTPPKQVVGSEILVEVNGRRIPVQVFDDRREMAPRPPVGHSGRGSEHVHNVIAAPMQGTILRVIVQEGQEIAAGDVICILEAMKMENHITSTRDGQVTGLPIAPGQIVDTGETLAVID